MVSSRADETLTYTKYVKDEETGKSIGEMLADKIGKTDKLAPSQIPEGSITSDKLDKLLLALIKSATGAPEDLLYQMAYLFKKIEGMTPITDEEIAQIIAGSYVPKDDDVPPVNPNSELKEQVAALTKIVDSLDVKDTTTRLKLQSFIDSYLTPESVDEILKE